MTWVVKKKGPDGKVSSTTVEDFVKATKMREEFSIKGLNAWIEDSSGQRVGFFVLTPAATKP